MSAEQMRTGLPSFEEMQMEIARKNHHVREQWVKLMEVTLVREELNKCYRGEGVNHLQNCKDLAERYTRMIRDNKIVGYHIVEN